MERNIAILTAIEDGYKQVEVAWYLGISDSAVSKIFLTLNKKSSDS
jgi:predicted transcriptional regulator